MNLFFFLKASPIFFFNFEEIIKLFSKISTVGGTIPKASPLTTFLYFLPGSKICTCKRIITTGRKNQKPKPRKIRPVQCKSFFTFTRETSTMDKQQQRPTRMFGSWKPGGSFLKSDPVPPEDLKPQRSSDTIGGTGNPNPIFSQSDHFPLLPSSGHYLPQERMRACTCIYIYIYIYGFDLQ